MAGMDTHGVGSRTDLSYGPRTARLYEPFMAAVTLGRYRSFVAAEVTRLDLRPSDRVLDLCCGTGIVVRELARRLGPRGEVIGVDSSEAMLEEAARRGTVRRFRGRAGAGLTAGGRVTYIRAPAECLPLPDDLFDWVTIFLGLHEIGRAARLPALGEVRRVLRPGGRGLILDFATGGSRLRRGALRLFLSALEGPDAGTICEPGVPALVSEAGLRPDRPRPVFLGLLEVTGFEKP